MSVTTTGAVPSGALVLIASACYLAGQSPNNWTVSAAGGLTWAKDVQKQGTVDTNRYCCIFSAQAPSGLASSTTLTLSLPVNANNMHMAVSYVTGQNTTTALDAAGAGNNGTSLAWSSGNVTTTQASTLLFAVGHRDALVTSSPDSGWTELNDFQNATESTTATVIYQVVSSTGTYNASGAWNTGTTAEWVAQVAAYKDASAGAGATSLPPVQSFRSTSSLYSR